MEEKSKGLSAGPTPALEIRISTDRCSPLAIDRAAHRFTGSYWVDIQQESDSFVITFLTKTESPSATTASLREQFSSILLDEILRSRVLEETRSIRDALVQQAFAGARPRLKVTIPE